MLYPWVLGLALVWGEAVHISLQDFSCCRSDLPILGSPLECRKVAERFDGGLIYCQVSRAAIRTCLNTDVYAGTVTLKFWAMRGTCFLSALLLQISGMAFLY